MKKFLPFILVIILSVLLLASCDGAINDTSETTAADAETTAQESQSSTESTETSVQTETSAITETTAEDDQLECTEGLVFTLINDGTAYSVTGYTGDESNVVIPAIYKGLPVTEIGENAFYYQRDTLVSVLISDNVECIGPNAFEGCDSLTSVMFGEGSKLKTIKQAAFYSCDALVDFEFPKGVEHIEKKAFSYCYDLVDIVLPDSVKCIEAEAFYGSGYYNNKDNWESRGKVLYIGKYLIAGKTPCGEVEVKEGTEYIAQEAFNGCQIGRLTFPESLKVIDMGAFANCTYYLRSVELPDGLTTLGDFAFAYCTWIESVKLPQNITHIGSFAFAGCFELKSIDIPDSVKTIGERAFVACSRLSTVTIGAESQLESIGAYAFSECKMTSVFLPSTVATISQNALNGCRDLEVINFAGSEAQWNDISKGTDWDSFAGERTETGTYTIIYNYEFPAE